MLCSDCDEEQEGGQVGYGGGVGRQERGSKREREREKNQPVSQKEGKESK